MAIHILLVENNHKDRALVHDVLKKEQNNFVVSEANSFTDFDKLVRARGYDIILVNPNLPKGKGINVLEAINTVTPQTPVVILYSGQSEIDFTFGKCVTPYFFINKQSVEVDLPATILTALDNKQNLKQYKVENECLLRLNYYLKAMKQLSNEIICSTKREPFLAKTSKIINKIFENSVAWSCTLNEHNGNLDPVNWPLRYKKPSAQFFNRFWELFYLHNFFKLKKSNTGYFLCNDIMAYPEIARVFTSESKNNIRSFVCFPLQLNQKVIGLFTIQAKKPFFFEEEEIIIVKELIKDVSSFLHKINDAEANKRDKLKLVEAKKEAEEESKLMSVFLLNISHEIRTPMNGILGFADLLNDKNLLPEQIHTYTDLISHSSKRMLETINNLVSISKIEAEEIELNETEIDLNSFLKDVSEVYKHHAEEKNLNFVLNECNSRLPFIYKTDKILLQFIISNLLMNAVKFTKKGIIELGYNRKVNRVEIYVKDTGIGIDEKNYELIFEKFRQGYEGYSRQFEGSGLGLAIAKAYVEKLNGKIWVRSIIGKGTIFYVNLPLDGNNKKVKTEMDIKDFLKSKNLKTLIVEDDRASAMLLKLLMKDITCEILEVNNGIEAVDICRKNKDIDLIVMDLQMAGINGYEATERIRKFNQDVIIIAQSAYAMVQSKEKALYMGCNDFITKPIQQIEFLSKIKKHF